MTKATSLVSFIQSVRKSILFAEDFNRGMKKPILSKYIERLEWITRDLLTSPLFYGQQDVIDAMREEMTSDTLVTDALLEKIQLLNPAHRECVEEIIDAIIRGEVFEVVKNEEL
jgi:hypothetical protein